MQHPSSIATASRCLCLGLCAVFSGCATAPNPETVVVTEIQIERVTPLASLMRPCPVPELGDRSTLGDVVSLAIERGQALVQCNDRLAAIRRSVESDEQ